MYYQNKNVMKKILITKYGKFKECFKNIHKRGNLYITDTVFT